MDRSSGSGSGSSESRLHIYRVHCHTLLLTRWVLHWPYLPFELLLT
jgi:hypothetical protein